MEQMGWHSVRLRARQRALNRGWRTNPGGLVLGSLGQSLEVGLCRWWGTLAG